MTFEILIVLISILLKLLIQCKVPLFSMLDVHSSKLNFAHLHVVIRTNKKQPSLAYSVLCHSTLLHNLHSMFYRHNVEFNFDVNFVSSIDKTSKHSAKCIRCIVNRIFYVLHFQ